MADNKNINEDNLNEFLRENFLANDIDDKTADFILKQEYGVTIKPHKEKELLNKLKGSGGGGFWGLYKIVTGILGIIAMGIIIYFTSSQKKEHPPYSSHADKKNDQEIIGSFKTDSSIVVAERNISEIKLPLLLKRTPAIIIVSDSQQRQHPEYVPFIIPVNKEGKLPEYPILSETDKKKFSRIKAMMLEKLLNTDKGLYTPVEAWKTNYMGKPVTVEAFIMRNMQVTNLEYKIFLADLLMKDKKEEYDKAVVKTNAWSNYGITGLTESYYEDPKYNDFPIVNISIEGALLFCAWLEKEANIYAKEKGIKTKPFRIRLPKDIEWISSVMIGYAFTPLCSGYNTLYEIKEGYVDDAFLKRVATIRKRKKKIEEVDKLYSTNRYGMSEKEMTDIFNKAFPYYDPLPSDTIYPTRMNRYCEIGHVSEMTYEMRSGNIMVIGCCWKSKEEYQQMLNEFHKANASPFVGFRPVIVSEGMAEYKNPFW